MQIFSAKQLQLFQRLNINDSHIAELRDQILPIHINYKDVDNLKSYLMQNLNLPRFNNYILLAQSILLVSLTRHYYSLTKPNYLPRSCVHEYISNNRSLIDQWLTQNGYGTINRVVPKKHQN